MHDALYTLPDKFAPWPDKLHSQYSTLPDLPIIRWRIDQLVLSSVVARHGPIVGSIGRLDDGPAQGMNSLGGVNLILR